MNVSISPPRPGRIVFCTGFRRKLIGLLFVFAAVPSLFAKNCPAQAENSGLPNIVVVLADDLGYGDLACYGHEVIKTPNLDQFARQGLRLASCYSGGAVCSPSRSAIQTGRTPYRNGVFTWIPEGQEIHLRTSEISIATLLKKKGYATCHVGKWHLNGKFNSPLQPQPSDHGYDWWMATQNNAAPSHKNPVNFVRNGKPVGPLTGYSSILVVEEAIRWLDEHRDASKPFFLNVCTHEPHLQIESDPQFMALYPDLVSSDPDRAQHHGNVTQLDFAFGMLMKKLGALGVSDNTLVVFTSDNGPEGGGTTGRTRGSTGGLRGRKRAVYEGGIRVPGVVRWPGHVKPGSESDTPVIGSDIFATICAVTGIPVPADRPIDGTSFLPILEGKLIDRQIPLYWRCNIAPGEMKIAMRVGDYKVVANEPLTKFELYNIATDRAETTDLASKEPERLASLEAQLRKLNAEIEAEGPTWWKDSGRKAAPAKKKEAKQAS